MHTEDIATSYPRYAFYANDTLLDHVIYVMGVEY